MPTVFVSYSRSDRAFLEREIINPLKGRGMDFWYDVSNIRAADVWEKRIREGLQKCDWFIVLLSKRSLESEWVHTEVTWAMKHRKDRIVPIVIEDCDPADLHLQLNRIQHVDFQADPEACRSHLVQIWDLRFSTEVPGKLDILGTWQSSDGIQIQFTELVTENGSRIPWFYAFANNFLLRAGHYDIDHQRKRIRMVNRIAVRVSVRFEILGPNEIKLMMPGESDVFLKRVQ